MHRSHLQAYYAEYDEQVEMNEMRYTQSNAKDYAQHSHPIEALSAAAFSKAHTPSLCLPTELRKRNIS